MTSYIEEQLQRERGERIVRLTHLSLWSLLPAFLASAACFAAAVAVLLAAPPDGALASLALPGALALGALGVAIDVAALVRFYTTEIGVTSRRVMMKTGLVARRAPEMVLDKVEGQELEQSGVGRVLGFGTVDVRGAGGERLPIRGVDDPVALMGAIMEARSARDVRTEPLPSPTARPAPVA